MTSGAVFQVVCFGIGSSVLIDGAVLARGGGTMAEVGRMVSIGRRVLLLVTNVSAWRGRVKLGDCLDEVY